MKIQRALASAASIVALSTGSLFVSAPAEANSFPSYISSPSGIAKFRSCPSATRCDNGFYIPNGSRVRMICYTDGEWATGAYRSNRWFKLTPEGGLGRTGWVHSSLVRNQTSVPRC